MNELSHPGDRGTTGRDAYEPSITAVLNEASAPPRRAPSKINGSIVCGLVAFLIVGSFAIANLSTWPTRISYPGEESYEGVALAEIVHLREGVPLYALGATDSYDAATYGPVYYFVGSQLVERDSPSYLSLRLLSAFGMFGCAIGCGLLAFWLSRNWLAACLSPVVFLSFGMVTDHGIQALSDGVALLLMFYGFLLAYRFRDSRAVLLAVPLMVLGFYYKPQYIAGPVAVFVFLLSERRYRVMAEFAALMGVCGVAVFAFCEWIAFSGQSFWHHFLASQASLFSWHQFGMGLFVVSFMFFVPLVFAAEYLRTNPDWLLGFYLCFSVALGILTFSKDGSGIHYFFESVLLISILLSAHLAEQIRLRALPIHLVLVFAIMVVAGQWSKKSPPQPTDFARHDAMQSFLRQNFPTKAEGLSASPSELLQAGLKTPFSGMFQLVQLAHRGAVCDRDLATQIKAHRFSVIVLNFDVSKERDPYWLNFSLTPALRTAIEQGYTLTASLEMPTPERLREQDRYYVYLPNVDKSRQ